MQIDRENAYRSIYITSKSVTNSHCFELKSVLNVFFKGLVLYQNDKYIV